MTMRVGLCLALALLAAPLDAGAQSATVTRTFAAPLEQVFTATESVLKSLGWTIAPRRPRTGRT